MKRKLCVVWLASLIGAGAAAGERRPGEVAYLTGPQNGQPAFLAPRYLLDNHAALGVTEGDLADLALSRVYASAGSGTTHVHFVQRHLGIAVWNGVASVNVASDGSIMNVGHRLVKDLATAVSGQHASLSAIDAVAWAAAGLGLPEPHGLRVRAVATGTSRRTQLRGGGLTRGDIPAELYYEPQTPGGPRLVWNVELELRDGSHWWNARIDAETGALLACSDWIVDEAWSGPAGVPGPWRQSANADTVDGVTNAGSYRVFQRPVESPNHGARSLVANPDDPIASPFGWHDTSGVAGPEFTSTRGNNVHAYTDLDANDQPDAGSSPNGGGSLVFDFALDLGQAPNSYRPAAVTNLFHWNNLMHDVHYLYGFDEAAGNFQVNNYGHGGLGGDAVNAEAQDGGGTNNARMTIPPDGQPPRMQMYLWTVTAPQRDGSLDNGVVAHEYSHGISRRLTGDSVNCLDNDERMSEGWSDWTALVMTMQPGASATDVRGIATYVAGQPTTGVGIRPQPYTTRRSGPAGTFNDSTYQDTRTLAVPHGVGFVWGTMLWDMTWALVADHGFNPDIRDTLNGGNTLALRLVTEGMKLQPCSPGFVDGRDAILLADLNLTGGANRCTIWSAFANRGLGASAQQGSSQSNADNAEAFDIPAGCGPSGGVNLIQNPGFESGLGGWTGHALGATDGVSCGSVFADGNCSFTLTGAAGVNKYLRQTLPAGAGGSFTFGARSRSQDAASGSRKNYRASVKFKLTGGGRVLRKLNFARASHDWQTASVGPFGAAAHSQVLVQLDYTNQAGQAWFDGLSLVRE